MKPWLVFLVFVLGLAGGFGIGYLVKSHLSAPRGLDSLLDEKDPWVRLKGLLEYIDTLSVQQIPAAIKQMEPKGISSENNEEALQALIHRWAELDANSAVSAEATADYRVRWMFIDEAYSRLADKNPEEALARAQQIPDGRNRTRAVQHVLHEWALHDPVRVWSNLSAMPDYRQEAASGIFQEWSKKDQASATATALQIRDQNIRNTALQAMVAGLYSEGFTKARAWVSALPMGRDQVACEQALALQVAYTDPAGAIDYIASLPADRNTAYALEAVAGVWEQSDPKSALERLRKFPPALGARAVNGILNFWGVDDPRTALAALDALSPDPQINADRQRIVLTWAQTSPGSAAVDYAKKVPDAAVREALLTALAPQVVNSNPREALQLASDTARPNDMSNANSIAMTAGRWYANDPKGAEESLSSLPAGAGRAALISIIADQKAKADAVSAFAWADKLPQADQPGAIRYILFRLISDAPAAAAKYIASRPTDRTNIEMLTALATRWAPSNPVATGAWLQNLPESPEREDSCRMLLNAWVPKDRAGAEVWLRGLPAAKLRDDLLGNFIQGLENTEPGHALDLIALMQDNNLRQNAERVVLRTWLQKDPAAARLRVPQTDLPADEKDRLMQGPPNGENR
jgi:hypothetical protein